MSDGNVHPKTVASFAREWQRFDQSRVDSGELGTMFAEYFALFPWHRIPAHAKGADVGCGSGRWARFVAPRVSELHCVDVSAAVIEVARSNLSDLGNVRFHVAGVDALPFEDGSLDFVYSLGVLHHVPDTGRAIQACLRPLKRGAPLLVYLYYAFDNRPFWYRWLWRSSDIARRVVAALPSGLQDRLCDAAALAVYWPLARLARVAERAGLDVSSFPLSAYRKRSLYTMRTDARDRFGTPLERRFTSAELRQLLSTAGLEEIELSDRPPYWCAVGLKK